MVPAAGVTLAGFFVPIVYINPGDPPGILADAIDPATGEYLSISRGFDPTDAAVLSSLTIRRASGSAVSNVGQRYHDLKILDDGAAQFISAETSRALKPLVDSKQIKLDSVEPTVGTDWAEVKVAYQNIPRRERRDPRVALGRPI